MSLSTPLQFADRAAGHLRDALLNPAGREHMVLKVLAAYVLAWTVYGTIAKGDQGLHPDMTELVAWSRDLASVISSIRRLPPGWCARGSHFSGRRVVILPVRDADAGDRAVGRLAAVGGLSRRREARRGPGAVDAGAVLQFPRAQVQRQHGADAVVGRDHVVVSALLHDAQHLYAVLALAPPAACSENTGRSFCLPDCRCRADRQTSRRLLKSAAPWITVVVGSLRSARI